MERIGQSKSIYIPIKTEVWGSFTSVHKTNLYKESTPCIRDNEYSFTYCMKNYLAATAGCHLDWAETKSHTMGKHNPCVTWEEVSDYCLLSSWFILLWLFPKKGTPWYWLLTCFVHWLTQVQRYTDALTTVSTLSWTDLVNETGCHAKCSYKQYSFEKVSCQWESDMLVMYYYIYHFRSAMKP